MGEYEPKELLWAELCDFVYVMVDLALKLVLPHQVYIPVSVTCEVIVSEPLTEYSSVYRL